MNDDYLWTGRVGCKLLTIIMLIMGVRQFVPEKFSLEFSSIFCGWGLWECGLYYLASGDFWEKEIQYTVQQSLGFAERIIMFVGTNQSNVILFHVVEKSTVWPWYGDSSLT